MGYGIVYTLPLLLCVAFCTYLAAIFDVEKVKSLLNGPVVREPPERQRQLELEHLRLQVDTLRAENKRLREINQGVQASSVAKAEIDRAPTAFEDERLQQDKAHTPILAEDTAASSNVSGHDVPMVPQQADRQQRGEFTIGGQNQSLLQPRSITSERSGKRQLQACTDDATWMDDRNIDCDDWIFNPCRMFTSVTQGACEVDETDDCIQTAGFSATVDSPAHYYPNGDNCIFEIETSLFPGSSDDFMVRRPLNRHTSFFQTESIFDGLTINWGALTVTYYGTFDNIMANLFKYPPATVQWISDDNPTNDRGFRLCAATSPRLALASGACTISADGLCASSENHPGNYPAGSACEIDVIGKHTLRITHFVASAGDTLNIQGCNNLNQCDKTGDLTADINTGGGHIEVTNVAARMTWTGTNGGSSGWNLCILPSTDSVRWGRYEKCPASCGKCMDATAQANLCQDDPHFASQCSFFAGDCSSDAHVQARLGAWNQAQSSTWNWVQAFSDRLMAHCPYSCNRCTRCVPGRYRDLTVAYTAADSCKDCEAGRYAPNVHQTLCEACPWGQYNEHAGLTYCIDCEAGRYDVSPESLGCEGCPEGRAGALAGQQGLAGCLTCPGGRFSNSFSGNTECAVCLAGKVGRGPGLYACEDCPLGTFQEEDGETECRRCGKGNYSDQFGGTQCSRCPPGFTSDPGAFRVDECTCPPGTYREGRLNESMCVECPPGFYCPGGMSATLPGDDITVELEEGYMASPENPLSAFSCQGMRQVCPGRRKPFLNLNSTADAIWSQVCPTGRILQACAWCPDGEFKTKTGCKPCGGADTALMFVAVPCFWGALCFLHLSWNKSSAKERVDLKALSVCGSLYFLYCQILGVFESVAINWQPPMSDFLQLASYMRMRLDFLKISCGIPVSPTREYMMRALTPISGIFSLYGVYFILWLLKRKQVKLPDWTVIQFFTKRVFYINTTGSIYMLFSSGMSLTAFLPFQCNSNPNGQLVNSEWPLVTCSWSDENWVPMVQFSVVAIFLYVVLFPSIGVWQVQRHGVAPQTDPYFFLKYKFLFGNYAPHARFFAIIAMCRNIGIAAVSAFLQQDTFFQVTAMMSVMIAYLCMVTMWWPWNQSLLNWIDAAGSFSLFLIIAIGAGFIEGDSNTDSLEVLLLVLLIGLATLFVLLMCWFAFSHFAGRTDYVVFLSHAKGNGGAVARLFKIILCQELNLTTEQIFLDSDNLLTLNDLTTAVQHTGNIVLLLTPGAFAREWVCVELVTTYLHKIHAKMMSINGAPPPDDNFNNTIPSVFAKSLEGTFPSLGIDLEILENTFKYWQKEIDIFEFDIYASPDAQTASIREVVNVMQLCARTRIYNKIFMQMQSLGSSRASSAKENFLKDKPQDLEAVNIYICREAGLDVQMEGSVCVLKRMLMKTMQCGAHIPSSNAEADVRPILNEIKQLKKDCLFCICLTEKVFHSRRAVLEIVTGVLQGLFIVPVNIDWRFEYPTDGFYEKLRAGDVVDLGGGKQGVTYLTALEALIRTMFYEIAIYLNANGNTKSIVDSASSIQTRYEAHKHAEDSVGKVKLRLMGEDIIQLEKLAKNGPMIELGSYTPNYSTGNTREQPKPLPGFDEVAENNEINENYADTEMTPLANVREQSKPLPPSASMIPAGSAQNSNLKKSDESNDDTRMTPRVIPVGSPRPPPVRKPRREVPGTRSAPEPRSSSSKPLDRFNVDRKPRRKPRPANSARQDGQFDNEESRIIAASKKAATARRF